MFSQEGAEKQAQLERSLREKAAVEKELEKVSISPQGTICHNNNNNDTFTIKIMISGVGEHANERESHLARGGATRGCGENITRVASSCSR